VSGRQCELGITGATPPWFRVVSPTDRRWGAHCPHTTHKNAGVNDNSGPCNSLDDEFSTAFDLRANEVGGRRNRLWFRDCFLKAISALLATAVLAFYRATLCQHCQIWNKLPEEVVSAGSVSAFISRLNSTHVSFLMFCFSVLCFFIYASFRAAVSAFWAFLSSRHSSVFTVFTVLYLCWWNKYSFIHSFIHCMCYGPVSIPLSQAGILSIRLNRPSWFSVETLSSVYPKLCCNVILNSSK